MKKSLTIYKPTLRRKDLEYVLNSMIEDSITYGTFAKEFEDRLSNRVPNTNVIAVNSYFSAILLVFEALGIKEGDEIIIPSFLPQIYLNIINFIKAKPVLVDIDENYFRPSLEKIREAITDKTKVLLLYYYFGYAYDPTPYLDLVPYVIEDISSLIGAQANGIKLGTAGKYAIADFSIKGLITTGEGAAIFSSRKNYYKLKSLLEIDYTPDYSVRFACLMPDINAALGISQDESLNHKLKIRESIGLIYEQAILRSNNNFIPAKENYDRYYTYFPIIVKSMLKEKIAYFKKFNIEVMKPFPYPLHHYIGLPKENFPNTEFYYLNTLLIPIHSTLLKTEVDKIAKILASSI